MSHPIVIEVLERIYADLPYRRRFWESPEAALADYDLTAEERRLLTGYPRCWPDPARLGPVTRS